MRNFEGHISYFKFS